MSLDLPLGQQESPELQQDPGLLVLVCLGWESTRASATAWPGDQMPVQLGPLSLYLILNRIGSNAGPSPPAMTPHLAQLCLLPSAANSLAKCGPRETGPCETGLCERGPWSLILVLSDTLPHY